MSYSIQKNDSNITTVIFSGPVDFSERKMSVDEICSSIDTSVPVKLLIDVRDITMDMSIEEQEKFGKYLASREQLSEAKVAVVHKPNNNPNAVITATAYLDGYHVVEFDNPHDANSWLLGYIK